MALIKNANNPKIPNGPIPGENYTSDTKNYPWHRPPDITNLDKGIEAIAKQISTKEGVFGILNTLQMGIPVVQVATIIVTSGIGAGKWTPDYAVLLAGPCARLIQIMADNAKIKYDMGLEDKPIPTIEFFKGLKEVNSDDVKIAGEAVTKAEPGVLKEAAKAKSGGFMSMTSPIPAGNSTPFPSPSNIPDPTAGLTSADAPPDGADSENESQVNA